MFLHNCPESISLDHISRMDKPEISSCLAEAEVSLLAFLLSLGRVHQCPKMTAFSIFEGLAGYGCIDDFDGSHPRVGK